MTDDEAVRAAELIAAQQQAARLFEAVTEAGIIRAGVRDTEASRAVTQLAAEQFGCEKHWHKRIVRSGPNTLQPYSVDPPDRVISDDDIVFADFGPVFSGWEADFGRTWVLGEDPVKRQLTADLPEVFSLGKQRYLDTPDINAAELFAYVTGLAVERGWEFGNKHCGHLVGEFPHENFSPDRRHNLLAKGNNIPLRTTDPSGRVAHWILEIHLVDRAKEIGGFYEELLTL